MTPVKYRILSHIADLRLEVYGKTMEELFANAVEAIAHILLPEIKGKVSTHMREALKIKSFDQGTLLVDFLNEVLAKSQINKMIYFVEKVKINPLIRPGQSAELEAEISGVRVDKFAEDIKAVTYHETEIKKEGEIYKAKLVLDI